MNKRDYFRQNNNQLVVASILALVACLITATIQLRQQNVTIDALRKSETVLRQQVASHYQTWIMDESCATQLKNSGMVQLKIR